MRLPQPLADGGGRGERLDGRLFADLPPLGLALAALLPGRIGQRIDGRLGLWLRRRLVGRNEAAVRSLAEHAAHVGGLGAEFSFGRFAALLGQPHLIGVGHGSEHDADDEEGEHQGDAVEAAHPGAAPGRGAEDVGGLDRRGHGRPSRSDFDRGPPGADARDQRGAAQHLVDLEAVAVDQAVVDQLGLGPVERASPGQESCCLRRWPPARADRHGPPRAGTG